MPEKNIYDILRDYLSKIIADNGLSDDQITVTAKTLTADEAIGNPEHDDYPLLEGRERMMEATIRGAGGQAFTDMYGRWEGVVADVLRLELTNNFRRAIFVATLNAALRFTRELNDTRHCKDEGPVECAKELFYFVKNESLEPPFVLVGFQPRFAETLSSLGELRILDQDKENIGQERYGAVILPPEETKNALDGCQAAFVTGTTLVNDTLHPFLNLPIPTVFYGVTIAGAAKIMGLTRYCARGL